MQEKQQEKSPIKQRILTFLSQIGISQYDFYKKTGITRGILGQNNGISEENITRFLAYFPEVSIEWLIMGHGPMLRDVELQTGSAEIEKYTLQTDNPLLLQTIPLYDLEASAGLVSLFLDAQTQTPINYLSIPELPSCDGALYVRGDSMYPLLKSGDIVLYKKVTDLEYGILWGEMYLVSFDVDGEEYICIKYLQRSDLADHVRLVSHNPHHDPKDIPLNRIRALAFVKASVRYNTMR